VRTKVGDRFVKQAISKYGLTLGGESSGHVIIPSIWCEGDGLIVVLMTLRMLKDVSIECGEIVNLSELTQGLNVTSQMSKSIDVSPEQKRTVKSEIKIIDVNGVKYKTIVRPSGTENVVRITVEGECKDQCEQIAVELVKGLNI